MHVAHALATAALLAAGAIAASRPEAVTPVVGTMTTTAVTRDPTVFDFHAASPTYWQSPVAAPLSISNTFGPRWKFSTDADDMHRGIDYYNDLGSPISAIADGTVFQVHTEAGGTFVSGGNTVVIEHPVPAAVRGLHRFHDRNITKVFAYYMHLQTIAPAVATVGAAVTKGQLVGGMGQSGTTTFTHLHFETRLQGYCSHEFQASRNRDPSPTSDCYTGYDPHVHPYLFVDGADTGSKTLVEINATAFRATPLSGTAGRRQTAGDYFSNSEPAAPPPASPPANGVYCAVKYCTGRGHLDLDVVETDVGTVAFNTRVGMTTTTLQQQDDLARIAPWLELRPLDFVSASSEICYELGFRRPVAFVELRDIYGRGIRATAPAACLAASAAANGTNGTTGAAAGTRAGAVLLAVAAALLLSAL